MRAFIINRNQAEKNIIKTASFGLNYNSANDLRTFLDEEGLGMRKKYGQNFLINPGIRQALVNALDAKNGAEVWEIGPGLGAMTALLLEKELQVKAFEIDAGFIRILKNIFDNKKGFAIIEGDVMKTWPSQAVLSGGKSAELLLGNLPYNIAAALLADMIEKGCLFNRMVVTVQKEVALRMIALPGTADYSSFSVLCASSYAVKPLMQIGSSSFYPRPNVDSMGVLLEKRDKLVMANIDTEDRGLPSVNPKIFFPLVRALFSSRRKTIKNNLLRFVSSPDVCSEVLKKNGLNGNERAEQLPVEVFLALAKSIDECENSTSGINRS